MFAVLAHMKNRYEMKRKRGNKGMANDPYLTRNRFLYILSVGLCVFVDRSRYAFMSH